jgi:hypothetical protein
LAVLSAGADEPSVPPGLQADLTGKVIAYVQQPPPRANEIIRIGILIKPGNADSTHVASELKAALEKIDSIAGLPHEQTIVSFGNADKLLEEVTQRRLFVLYLTPGLGGDVGAIAHALDGVPLVTVASVDTYVADGAILGFEQVSGRPRMVLNLAQAKQQGVTFQSAVMKLMRIVE